ncbi:MAG: hypothetical protein AB1746_03700 [Candidatus Zixiibacteriota bacterium]
MLRRYRTIAIFICAVVLLVVGEIQAAQLQSKVLQYKLDRLYFSFGEEAFIFKNGLFILYDGADSILAGKIELSQPGVSYSFPLADSLVIDDMDSLYALIETADIDSVSRIRIGFDLPEFQKLNERHNENIPGEIAPALQFLTTAGNILEIAFYESFMEMTMALEAHQIDGFISMNEYRPSNDAVTTTACPAEFFAALLPVISHPVNNRGILSTSMYYRFNEAQSAAYYNGDGARPFNTLYLKDSTGSRFYEYNPERGRKLLNALDKKPKEIAIAVSERTLYKTANYFIDVLNRDRMKCRLEKDRNKNHDIYLDFVTISEDDPVTSLRYIVNVIAADTSAGDPVNTVLRIIDNYIRRGDAMMGTNETAYYYNRAERSLVDDLGVFPLYRPTIYMTSYKYITGFTYDMYINSRFDEIGRIILPGDNAK